MTDVFCGIDFGTTNSSAALASGDDVQVLELDPVNDSPTSLPSLLYMSREGESLIGRGAANAFIERNVDREVLLETVDLGVKIAGYVGGEGDNDYGGTQRKDGFDITETVSAKAMVEVNSPGRLFQSLKTSLRFGQYTGTEIFGTHYQIEELTALVLKRIKSVVDQAADQSVDTAVFGRPVRFSKREDENETAIKRLERAAQLAGFKNVVFFYEPVGACVEYAVAKEERQRLMVVDIGGGTFDVCVMEFGGGRGARQRLTDSRILGVAGIPVAGDAIDHEITRQKVMPFLGSKARYGPAQLRFPQYLFNHVVDWQNLYKLNTEETINWLIAAGSSSDDPTSVRALRALIQRNLGYPLRREVEAAKKRLSFEPETSIQFHRPSIDIRVHLEQQGFAHIIDYMLDEMLECLKESERVSGVKPDQIDGVLTTGGTSLIPAVRQMLETRYGAERLQQRDTFTSVASGLAIVAQHL